MRFTSSILMAGMLSASLVCAEHLTQARVGDTQPGIDEALPAQDGGDRLTSMHFDVVGKATIADAGYRSSAPELSRDWNSSGALADFDFANGTFIAQLIGWSRQGFACRAGGEFVQVSR